MVKFMRRTTIRTRDAQDQALRDSNAHERESPDETLETEEVILGENMKAVDVERTLYVPPCCFGDGPERL